MPVIDAIDEKKYGRLLAKYLPGVIRIFLSDGTLLTTSLVSQAALNMWTYKNGNLTIVEGSLPYKVEILKLDQTEFRIRVHGQEGPVELAMAPAEQIVFE